MSKSPPQPPPLSRRELNKLATREAIFEAAMNLFSSRGFEATTIDEIAAASGVSKGTVFNYFPTKEAIVGYVAVQHLTWLVENRGTIMEGKTTARAKYEALFGTLVARLSAQAESLDVALGLTLQRIGKAFEPHAAEVAFMHVLIEIASEGMASGELRRDLAPIQVPMLVLAMYAGTMTVSAHSLKGDRLVEQVAGNIGLLLEGLSA